MDLKDIRKDIDAIDSELITLLTKRMECSLKVAEIKRAEGLPIYHPGREKEILDKVTEKGGKYGSYFAEIYSLLMQCSREVQHQENTPDSDVKSLILAADSNLNVKGKVACYGEEGAFTRQALISAFGEENITPLYSKTFEGVFKAVNSGEAPFGFLPVENSSAGSVDEVYDLLLKYKLFIVASASMPVVHNLLGLENAEISDIKMVYSHKQALGQCSKFLTEKGIAGVEYENTASAAKYVASLKDKSIGAIGSKTCADFGGLKILAPAVQSFENNKTRFILLSKTPIITENSEKISVVFSLDNTPGSLQKILTRFSLQGLNLTKLESRAGKNGDFETQFYLDFLGSAKSQKTLSLLSAMNNELADFYFLGNYKETILKGEV